MITARLGRPGEHTSSHKSAGHIKKPKCNTQSPHNAIYEPNADRHTILNTAHLQVVVAAVSVVFQSHSGKGEEDVVASGNGHQPHTVTVMWIVARVTRAVDSAIAAFIEVAATNWKEQGSSGFCSTNSCQRLSGWAGPEQLCW